RPLRRRLLRRVPPRRPRPRARDDLAPPLDEPSGAVPAHRPPGAAAGLLELPAREVALLDRRRPLRRLGLREEHDRDARRPPPDPVPEDGLHLLRARPGARARRHLGVRARLRRLRPPRDADGDDRRRRLLEARRRRAHVRVRAADVHHRRRHRPGDPADRDHAPVRQLRRVEHRRQLHPARRAAPDLEPRAAEVRVNDQIRKLSVLAVLLLVALIGATTYWQAWAAGDLADKQDNAIAQVAQFTVDRGLIYAADGTPLAANRPVKAKDGQTFYFRRYPQGDLASDVVGYSTQSRFRTGLERSENDYLTASNAHLDTVLNKVLDRLKGTTVTGNSLVLTLNPRAQRQAIDALGDNCGAVVALEPPTGKVLVMATTPAYDPNLIERSFDTIAQRAAHARCSPPAPLLNRGTAGLYVPGSTFKLVTAAAALDTGKVGPQSHFFDKGYCIEYGRKVKNFGDQAPEAF